MAEKTISLSNLTAYNDNIKATYQAKTDSSLATTNKTVVGAINENKTQLETIANENDNQNSRLDNLESLTGGNGQQNHSHANKTIIDKFTEVNGELLYKGEPIGGGNFEILEKTIAYNVDNSELILANDIVDCISNVEFTKGSVGESITNLLYKSDTFETPTTFITYYQAYKGTKGNISNGVCKFTVTDNTTTPLAPLFKCQLNEYHTVADRGIIEGHKYYMKHKKGTDGVNYTLYSSIVTATATGLPNGTFLFNYTLNPSAIGDTLYIKDCILIDLSAMYGVGSEPDKTTCDTLYGDVWTATSTSGSNNNFILKSYDYDSILVDTLDTSTSKTTLTLKNLGKITLTTKDVKPTSIKLNNVKYKSPITEGGGSTTPTADKIWEGKKWVAFGDSLTDETILQANRKYCHIIAEKTGITHLNYGKGGTGYKRTEANGTCFYQRMASIPTDTDIITIFGSINDWLPLNSYDPNYDGFVEGSATDTFDKNSLCGYINKALDVAIQRCSDAKIGLITPPPSKLTVNLDKIRNAISKVSEYRNIPYLDLWKVSQMRPLDNVFAQKYYYDYGTETMCHPNNAGHEWIYPVMLSFMKTMIG